MVRRTHVLRFINLIDHVPCEELYSICGLISESSSIFSLSSSSSSQSKSILWLLELDYPPPSTLDFDLMQVAASPPS